MHLSHDKVYTMSDLQTLLAKDQIAFDPKHIAVEGLVFDKNYNWILMRRGAGCRDEQYKLEGIGGRVDDEDNLVLALTRELKEEAGETVKIEVIEPLEVRTNTVFDSKVNKNITWIIISFVCIYVSGEFTVCEPTKNLGFEKFDLTNIDINELSSSAKAAYETLENKWFEVKALIAKAISHY